MIRLIKKLVARYQRNKLAKCRLKNNKYELFKIYNGLEMRGY